MPTMNRAFWIIGVLIANASGFPSRIWGEWQPVQAFAVEAENIPIVSMNSSTGIPLRTRMSLKNVSDIRGVSAGGVAWRAAKAVQIVPTSTAIRSENLRLFTAAVAIVVPEVHLGAVRQRPRHH